MAGLMSMGALATMHTENQGHLAPRTAEYAQDKMEQLLALAYTDRSATPWSFPDVASGGVRASPIGGGANTAAPVNGYVDWLAGRRQPARRRRDSPRELVLRAGVAGDLRFGHVQQQPAVGIKQIAVTATVRSSVGGFMLAEVNGRGAESLAVLSAMR